MSVRSSRIEEGSDQGVINHDLRSGSSFSDQLIDQARQEKQFVDIEYHLWWQMIMEC